MAVKTKKQIVIEEAARLFRDKGYAAASMRELAGRVGLEQASSLYNHIKSKEEALQQICFDNAHKFIAGITTIEQEYEDPLTQIRALIALHVNVAINDITSVTVFNDEWRHLTEPQLGEFLTLRKNYEDRFVDIIKKGMEQGVLKDMDPVVVLHTLLSAVKWLHYWYRSDKKVDPTALEQQIANILLNGIQGH